MTKHELSFLVCIVPIFVWMVLKAMGSGGRGRKIFEIKHRRSGAILFSVVTTSWRLAVEAAIKSEADLRWANLSEADLRWANLSEADLRWADLRWANLSEADLRWADLRWADLRWADLRWANLRWADLSEADLTPVRDDLWAILAAAPCEVMGLRTALVEGRVNGSAYQGECACLVGTIANLKRLDYNALPLLRPNGDRPIERFCLAIRPGATPDNSAPVKLVVSWIDTWLENIYRAFVIPPPAGVN